MTDKNEESIKLKKSTFIIVIVVILAVIAALTTLYFVNKSKDKKITTEEILSMEPVELDVTAIIVKDCTICLNMTQVIEELKQAPFVNVRQSNVIFASTRNAKRFIDLYDIKKLPTLILEGENVKELPLRGFNEFKNAAVMEEMPPPYIDLETQDLVGLVDITYLTDDSCTECYPVEQHKQVFTMAFGIYINNEKTIDISSEEGKALLEKYDITKVPTVLLTEEAGKYQTVQEVWDQIGTVEEDGIYVFRGFEMTQDLIYKDLETNQLVNTSVVQNEE